MVTTIRSYPSPTRPLAVELVKNGKPKVYEEAPHGMCTTHKDEVNEDLLAFIKG